jgi:hypothetical protein
LAIVEGDLEAAIILIHLRNAAGSICQTNSDSCLVVGEALGKGLAGSKL